MLVVREVCRMLETKTVIPTTNSVREGFLMHGCKEKRKDERYDRTTRPPAVYTNRGT